MRAKRALTPILFCALLLIACDYIVLPEEEGGQVSADGSGWSAVVTNVGESEAGDLHIDITIRNETGDWSAMKAVADRPAVLRSSDGKTANCDTVHVSTGGHRLAPGFQMRGFTAGTKAEPIIQMIYVECSGAEVTPGAKLFIDYSYVTGEYNYYYQEAGKVNAELELDLDQVTADLAYPIAETIEGLILSPSDAIEAINECVLTLTGIDRSDAGLQFTWQAANPGEYPSYVHIGIPPVLGADGILYGLYESPDIASVPVAGAGKSAEWTTEVAVPADATGLYILLSVESKQQRLFFNHAIDITDQ
jgi:hypothetical protein